LKAAGLITWFDKNQPEFFKIVEVKNSSINNWKIAFEEPILLKFTFHEGKFIQTGLETNSLSERVGHFLH
jgi:hypothetical protein